MMPNRSRNSLACCRMISINSCDVLINFIYFAAKIRRNIDVCKLLEEKAIIFLLHKACEGEMLCGFGEKLYLCSLNNMRKFYLLYPNCQTVSDKLSWSHICELITIEDSLEREFYENECIAENWGVKTLHRQMESGLFMRLAISKDKEGVLQLAHRGQQVQTPEDVVKNTYTLEFLGIEEKKRYKEKELEDKLIDKMQMFLLELGKGFTFVKRQYPLTINNIHYHIDLVFYHRILRCFVLI